MQTPLYQASIQILVGQNQGLMADPSQAINLQNAAITFSEAVATRPVGERVVNSLNLEASPDDIAAGTSAEVVNSTQFIEVTYTDDDPRDAQRIANAIGDAFSAQVSEVSPKVNGVSATVWESADLPQAPISPKPLRNGLIGFVIGGMLGLGLALLREHLDDRWQSAEEAEHVSGAPTLGMIPRFEFPKAEKR
jgi:capsular polysaccharide biosynthesis protein